MAKISKTVVDATLRDLIFDDLLVTTESHDYNYQKINDRQYGILITDLNGVERYCRIGVIVAEEREDMSARELMESEIRTYEDKQVAKAEKAKAKEEKIARDKARREAKAKEKAEAEEA